MPLRRTELHTGKRLPAGSLFSRTTAKRQERAAAMHTFWNWKRRVSLCLGIIILLSTAVTACAATQTAEEAIREALGGNTSYAFVILDDHVFVSPVEGVNLNKRDSGTIETPVAQSWAESALQKYSAGFVVRIDNGIAAMENSTEYTCVLRDIGQAILIEIAYVEDYYVKASITGSITGDTLTAYQTYESMHYSSMTGGMGSSYNGKYTVSVARVAPENLAPLPVVLSSTTDKDKRTITLSWTDPTPTGAAAYYEIYRDFDLGNDYACVATVVNGTSWTDDSAELQSDYTNFIRYRILSYSESGIVSYPSNELDLNMDSWE